MSDFHTGMALAMEADRQHDEERRELAQLKAQLAEAKAVLKLVEPHLTTCSHPARCPCCQREFTTFGHVPDCRLAKVIGEGT